MRSRRSVQEEVAEVARRRLELLSAELAELRPGRVEPPSAEGRGGLGEPPPSGPGPDPELGPWSDPRPAQAPVPGRHAHRPVGPQAALSGWVGDRLPPTLQGRVRMSPGHLVVVAVVVAVALAFTAWQVSRAGDGSPATPAAVPAPSPLVPVGSPAPTGGPPPAVATDAGPGPPSAGTGAGATAATGSGSATPTGSVVVDVTGKVRKPGIATLPPGSRVVDALEAAGGARRGVALRSLNLARVLTDGEQIVVGVKAPTGVAASAASAPGGSSSGAAVPMVNVNTADQAELEQLPGIGPVTALAILDFRSQQGTFTSVDELLEVSGIGDATLAKIAPYVTL